jgi:SCY1-like protein 1
LKEGFAPNFGRPIPTKFVSEARARGKYLQNEFVDSNLFLDELAMKDTEERAEFYKMLPGILDRFPQDFCVHKCVCCAL